MRTVFGAGQKHFEVAEVQRSTRQSHLDKTASRSKLTREFGALAYLHCLGYLFARASIANPANLGSRKDEVANGGFACSES